MAVDFLSCDTDYRNFLTRSFIRYLQSASYFHILCVELDNTLFILCVDDRVAFWMGADQGMSNSFNMVLNIINQLLVKRGPKHFEFICFSRLQLLLNRDIVAREQVHFWGHGFVSD